MAHRIANDPLPHLRRREGLLAGLKAAADDCLVLAEREMNPPSSDEGVHRIRQAFKRARAILRLLEDAGVASARSLRNDVTAAARKFSGLRDAAVMAKMAARVAKKKTDDAGAVALELAAEEPGTPDAGWWSRRRREVTALRRRLARLDGGGLSPHEIERSLEIAAKRACRGGKKSQRGRDIESAHAWRKKIILLREQISVARPLLGDEAAELHARLKRLAKRLGRAIDWRVFLDAVARHPNEIGDGKKQLLKSGRKKQKRDLKKARKRWPKVARRLRRDFL